MTWWDTSAGANGACLLVAASACAYATAAGRPSPRGNRWPRHRTVCFLAGCVTLLAVFGSPLAVYEDRPAVHVVQHMLLMMGAPALLALGAPITLLLRSLPPRARRAVVGELRDSSLRLLSGRYAPALPAIDYYLSMYVYQLTPVRTFTEQHTLAHFGIHAYFLICGAAFWWPVAASDPTRLRLDPTTRRLMVATGIPAFAVLGWIELAKGDAATGWAYVATGTALTATGLGLLALGRGSLRGHATGAQQVAA
ncbi:MAG: cytochrome c oxidase assembly protein [Solirubrobacteraceae bacterium]